MHNKNCMQRFAEQGNMLQLEPMILIRLKDHLSM